MGKVRTTLIKRLARRIVEKYFDRLSSDFDHNKKVVEELYVLPSKRFRNLVAGYVTHLYRIKERRLKERQKAA